MIYLSPPWNSKEHFKGFQNVSWFLRCLYQYSVHRNAFNMYIDEFTNNIDEFTNNIDDNEFM